MNDILSSLKINIGFMLNQAVGFTRDVHFDLPAFVLPPDLSLGFLRGVARLSRTAQGILVQCDLDASVPAECVRCLESFDQPLHAHFDELFAFNRRSMTESGLLVPEDANLNLMPLIREFLLLEIPIQTVCKPDCRGLCSVCGENLNLSTCAHASAQAAESKA